MGPDVDEGDPASLGDVACTADGAGNLLIVMENDLTTAGEVGWGD